MLIVDPLRHIMKPENVFGSLPEESLRDQWLEIVANVKGVLSPVAHKLWDPFPLVD